MELQRVPLHLATPGTPVDQFGGLVFQKQEGKRLRTTAKRMLTVDFPEAWETERSRKTGTVSVQSSTLSREGSYDGFDGLHVGSGLVRAFEGCSSSRVRHSALYGEQRGTGSICIYHTEREES